MTQVILKACPAHVSLIIGNQEFSVIDAHSANWEEGRKLPISTTLDIIHNILNYGNIPHTVIGKTQNWTYQERGTGKVIFEDGELTADTISLDEWEFYHIELKEVSPVEIVDWSI